MTTFDRLEPRLPELIDELATARTPDYFDDLLQATAHARQRPAWSAPERWLPMGEIARPLPRFSIPWRPIIVLASVALLIVAGLLISAGSQPRIPAPFGPAANGVMYYHSTDGVIHALDPATGISTAVVSGPEPYRFPWPSRDGRRIVYESTDLGISQYVVADADGSDAHRLAGDYERPSWVEWSPDDRQVMIISVIDSRMRLSLAAADGSGTERLPIDREVKVGWFLPDGRIAMIAGETSADRCAVDVYESVCAVFVSSADGRDLERVMDAPTYAGLSLWPSPDGKSLLYVRWTDGDIGRLHIVDIDTKLDHRVDFDNRDPAGDESNSAEFSPDGSLILFDRYLADGEYFAVVPTAGGTVRNIGRAWDRPDGTLPVAHFSPDGKSVLAYYPTSLTEGELWILDVTGEGEDRRLDVPLMYLPAWQRTAS